MVSIDGGWRSVLPTWWTLHRPLLTAQGSQQSRACVQIENGEHLGFKLSKFSSQDYFGHGHGFVFVEDCITLHQEVKWGLANKSIFQKRKKWTSQIRFKNPLIQRSARADRWGCEGQRSLIGEDYITPMGRAGGGGGQRIQPASLTSMCIVHCLRRQNSLLRQDGVLSIQWDWFDPVFFVEKLSCRFDPLLWLDVTQAIICQ